MAAFKAAGIEMLDEPLLFDPATTGFAPVVTRLISKDPDIVCLDTCYSDYVHRIAKQLFQQGFKGQSISCTADFYDQMIAKTSEEFMEGFVFQFPDFDEPALNGEKINFTGRNGFSEAFNARHPGQLGAELLGIGSALVGDWPVVVIESGKARIKNFRAIPD
nr:ABC transporter substrate-binding protein [Leisingera methylohalidivorans]